MSDGDWLSKRAPAPPGELASAIRGAVRSPDPTPLELLEGARSLLEKVIATECAHRDSALDLLTADALITYALELANERGEGVADFPDRAMSVLAQ